MSQGGNDAGTAQKAIHFGGAEQPGGIRQNPAAESAG